MAIATFKDLCIDADNAHLLATFWASALDLRPTMHDDGDASLDGLTPSDKVWVNTVAEPHTAKNRVHVDVHGDSVEEYEAWGATRVSAPDEFPWTVMADPEGGEFCVFVREQVPERRLYEIVVDSVETEAIARWWADVFAAHLVADDRGFHWIDEVPGFPADSVSFVPVPEPKTVKNRVHWDVVGNVEDLVGAGATAVSERGALPWVVMQDPEGNEFCVFEHA